MIKRKARNTTLIVSSHSMDTSFFSIDDQGNLVKLHTGSSGVLRPLLVRGD